VPRYPIAVQASLWSAGGAGKPFQFRSETAFPSGVQQRAGTGHGRRTTRQTTGPSVSSSSASRFRRRGPNLATPTNGANCSNSSERVLPKVASTLGTCPRDGHRSPGRRHRASDPRAVILPAALLANRDPHPAVADRSLCPWCRPRSVRRSHDWMLRHLSHVSPPRPPLRCHTQRPPSPFDIGPMRMGLRSSPPLAYPVLTRDDS
jgi:hypothetical protein